MQNNDEESVVLEIHHVVEIHDCEECPLCNQDAVTIDKACQREGCDDNQSSDINNSAIIPCLAYNSLNGYCKWGTNCRYLHQGKRGNTENDNTHRFT